MRAQVAIVGAGPAGLMRAQLLGLSSKLCMKII